MTRTLIKAKKIVTLDSSDTIHEPGAILIHDDRIESVGTDDQSADEIIDLGNRLIMPGLVNTHTHSPMTMFRGRVEGHSLFGFDGWYNTIRVVEEKMTPDMLPAGVRLSCAEMIRTGTTTFADQYFWMDQIVPEVDQSGLRAGLAYGVVELGDETARERELKALNQFLESLQDVPLLTGWVGPHAFFVDNSLEAMRLEMEVAEKYSTGMHFHLSTSGEEDRYCQKHFGMSSVAKMKEMGITDYPLIAAHCIEVPETDFATLAESPFTAVVCLSSAMRNAAGLAKIKEMHEAGVNLAVGTDNVTNNNSYDMFKEMQIIGKMMAFHHATPNALPTRTILDMATMGGARALGLEDEIGSLEAGKKADLIALDLDEIGWGPSAQDVYTAMVYSITGQHVRDVMVDGKWLFRDDDWATIRYADTLTELEDVNHRLEKLIRG